MPVISSDVQVECAQARKAAQGHEPGHLGGLLGDADLQGFEQSERASTSSIVRLRYAVAVARSWGRSSRRERWLMLAAIYRGGRPRDRQ